MISILNLTINLVVCKMTDAIYKKKITNLIHLNLNTDVRNVLILIKSIITKTLSWLFLFIIEKQCPEADFQG